MSYWKRRGAAGGDWKYYSPAIDEQTPHPMWAFLRLVQKVSGEWMLEARRARADKWVRIAIGHGTYDVRDVWTSNWPTIEDAIERATARNLLPQI